MIKPHRFIAYLGGCALSVMALFPSIAQAQVTVSPLIIEVKAERGQAKGTIDVTNVTDQTFRARVYAVPFTYNRDGIEILESSPTDLTPYLVFSPRELVVEPRQTRRIRMSSRLLPSLKDGEYRALLFTENLQTAESTSNGVTVGLVPRIGVTVYVRHGETASNLTIGGASLNTRQRQINLLVSNSGNASVRPSAEWTFSQGGSVIKTGTTPETTVIAEGDRHLSINYLTSDQKVTPGAYKLTGKLIWGDKDNPKTLPFDQNVTISAQEAATANKPPEDPTQRGKEPPKEPTQKATP
jgi:P pilus assembly chaperone PapD